MQFAAASAVAAKRKINGGRRQGLVGDGKMLLSVESAAEI